MDIFVFSKSVHRNHVPCHVLSSYTELKTDRIYDSLTDGKKDNFEKVIAEHLLISVEKKLKRTDIYIPR